MRIGSGHHHAASFVFVVVERLARRHPRMVFHLTSANTTELLESELCARNVDLLVARRWGSISDERLTLNISSMIRTSLSRARNIQ